MLAASGHSYTTYCDGVKSKKHLLLTQYLDAQ